MKTTSKVLKRAFEYECLHKELIFLEEENWLCDDWDIIIDGETFGYNTGMRHRLEDTNKYSTLIYHDFLYYETAIDVLRNYKPFDKVYRIALEKVSKPVNPLLDDVLFYLLDISETIVDYEDWCFYRGYDESSTKAIKIYKEYLKLPKKLKKILTNLEDARKAFRNYQPS